MAQGAQPVRSAGGTSWVRIVTAVALAIVAAVVVWLIVKGDGTGDKPAGPSSSASAATLSTIRALPGELEHDVYWAGERSANTYELTEVQGNIFIRYLPPGIRVGDPRPDYLTIGTYPAARAYSVLSRRARQRGNRSRRAVGGGIAVWSDRRPQSVYLAYPRANIQVEVYDPSSARARWLATSGAVEPIN
jgi:hypothetical protein